MTNTVILGWVTFIYLGAALFFLIDLLRDNPKWGRLAVITTGVGWTAHTFALVLRWIESYRLGFGHAPLANFYESLIFFSWAIVIVYLVVERYAKSGKLGAFILPFAFIFIAYASLSPNISDRIQPLIPALQSNWLACHVITCFLGYAAFAVAFGTGILYLVKSNGIKKGKEARFFRKVPELDVLDELIYHSVSLGFVVFTVGIMTGSVWAHYAWGSYWSWDPKETWSLITWIVYAVMLHARIVRGRQGGKMAVMTVIGFCAVLFTYFGVNYLPGLHSYLG